MFGGRFDQRSIIVSVAQQGGEPEHGLAAFGQVEPIVQVLLEDGWIGDGQAGGAGGA